VLYDSTSKDAEEDWDEEGRKFDAPVKFLMDAAVRNQSDSLTDLANRLQYQSSLFERIPHNWQGLDGKLTTCR
jgi:hypothetical protein